MLLKNDISKRIENITALTIQIWKNRKLQMTELNQLSVTNSSTFLERRHTLFIKSNNDVSVAEKCRCKDYTTLYIIHFLHLNILRCEKSFMVLFRNNISHRMAKANQNRKQIKVIYLFSLYSMIFSVLILSIRD